MSTNTYFRLCKASLSHRHSTQFLCCEVNHKWVNHEWMSFLGLCNKEPQTGYLKEQDFIISVLEVTSPKQRCGQSHAPSEIFPSLSYLLAVTGSHWHSLAYRCIPLISASIVNSHLLLVFFKGHKSHRSRVYSQDLILTWLYPQRLHFQIRAHPLIQETRISVYLLTETQFNPSYL